MILGKRLTLASVLPFFGFFGFFAAFVVSAMNSHLKQTVRESASINAKFISPTPAIGSEADVLFSATKKEYRRRAPPPGGGPPPSPRASRNCKFSTTTVSLERFWPLFLSSH